MTYRRKLASLFVSAAFILTFSLSFFFVAAEISHDHGQDGDTCPICEKIDLCLRTLSTDFAVTDPADGGGYLAAPHLFFFLLLLPLISHLTVSSTLVTLRVKLTD